MMEMVGLFWTSIDGKMRDKQSSLQKMFEFNETYVCHWTMTDSQKLL